MAAHAFGGGALEIIPECPQVNTVFAGVSQLRTFINERLDIPTIFSICLHDNKNTIENIYCQSPMPMQLKLIFFEIIQKIMNRLGFTATLFNKPLYLIPQ